MNFLDYIANNNFFDKPTFIRKIQCNIFGHDWFTWATDKKHGKWCAWCARPTGDYPKMRRRQS